MTQDQLIQAYFEAIKEFTNNFKNIEELTYAPLTIQMAVEKMLAYSKRDSTIKSKSIADLGLTYHDIKGMPNDVLSLIYPHCKAGF